MKPKHTPGPWTAEHAQDLAEGSEAIFRQLSLDNK